MHYIKNTDIGLTDKTENSTYDDRNGVRSMGITSDGLQLATGDRAGNIRFVFMFYQRLSAPLAIFLPSCYFILLGFFGVCFLTNSKKFYKDGEKILKRF